MSAQVITWDEWEATYKPIHNPASPDGGLWGCLFETHGEDLEQVKALAKSDRHIWTLTDNNPNSVYLDIVNASRWANRMGYWVTEEPWTDDTTVSNDPSYN